MSAALRNHLRRGWARLIGSPTGPRRPGRAGPQAVPPLTVPLTVRTRTEDAAELRLLLDAVVAPSASSAASDDAELERVAHALLVPATERWVRRHPLVAIQHSPARARSAIEESVRPEFAGLGATLLRLDIVAIEHLLLSPSADSDTSDHDSDAREAPEED